MSDWWRDRWLWWITAIAAALMLWNLGGRCLWQDEAETALLGRSILRHGVPVGTDGINIVSQELKRELGPDGVWHWSPWVQFYLAATGMKLFGASEFGIRLPFVLLGIPVVPLTYVLARRIRASVVAARFSAIALASSAWFLLQVRQARWPAPAYLLVCIILLAVFETRRSSWASVVLALSGAAFFYTNYFDAICFLVAIAVASPLLQRDRLFFLRLGAGLAGAALLSLPGVIAFHIFGKAEGGPLNAPIEFLTYLVRIVTYLAPLPLVVIAAWTDRRPETRFLLGICVAAAAMLALAPWSMFRYVSILFPVGAILCGIALAWITEHNALAGWAVTLLFIFTNVLHNLPLGYIDARGTFQVERPASPLLSFIREIFVPPRDPDCMLADYLRAHAAPHDTVLATYGDLVLQFYTPFHVTGGFEGEPFPANPDWIVARSFLLSTDPRKDLAVRSFISRNVDPKKYQLAATIPDPGLAGNPDPTYHLFTEQPQATPMVIYRRVR